MGNDEFTELIKIAVKDIPQEFVEKLDNVTVTVQEWPNQDQILHLRKRGERGLLLGLYEGVPRTKRRSYGIGGQLPDKITIFKQPILLIAKDFESVKSIVKDTVIHEIAHHFGLSEEAIRSVKRVK